MFIVALVSWNALLASSFLGSHEHSVPPLMHRGYVPCGHYPGGAALFSLAIPASNPPSSVAFLQEQRVDVNVQKPIRDGSETSIGVPRPESTWRAGTPLWNPEDTDVADCVASPGAHSDKVVSGAFPSVF